VGLGEGGDYEIQMVGHISQGFLFLPGESFGLPIVAGDHLDQWS
jgi:hypothetical protein